MIGLAIVLSLSVIVGAYSLGRRHGERDAAGNAIRALLNGEQRQRASMSALFNHSRGDR